MTIGGWPRVPEKVARALGWVWNRWKAIAHVIGNFQARLLLSAFYFVVLAPFGIGVRLFSDRLRLKGRSEAQWMPRSADLADAWEKARRQF